MAASPLLRDPERLVSADNRTRLASLLHSERLARGCVIIIGIDAIRERLGAHWPSRCDMVWDAIARTLDRRLAPPALWARASEVDYVLCASDDPATSRITALKILRELLEFFLGVQRFKDMRIATVLSMTDDFDLTCASLDPRAVEGADSVQKRAPRPQSTGWSSLTFTVADGGETEMEFHREQVVNLRNDAAIANRLWTRLKNSETGLYLCDRWPERLPAASLAVVNAATADRAKTLYATSRLGVMLSVSIHALAQNRNRAEIIRHFEQVRKDPLRPILLELLDVEAGTPQMRIDEVISVLAPHCRKILARVEPDRIPVDLLRGSRLAGLSIDCEPLKMPRFDLVQQLSRFSETARRVGRLAVALRLNDKLDRDTALNAGLTHYGATRRLA